MTTRIQAVYDTSSDVPDTGHQFMHCAKCLSERPEDQTPREWARQQLSVLGDGRLQLRCTRHDLNIATIRFEAVEARS